MSIQSECPIGLIGDDIEAVAKKKSKDTGKTVVPVRCEGFRGVSQSLGHHIANDTIREWVFPKADKAKKEGTLGFEPGPYDVAIIGDYNIGGDAWSSRILLEEIGLRIVAQWSGDGTLNEMMLTPCVKLNLVHCYRSMNYIARHMEEVYGVPWLEYNFFGPTKIAESLRQIASKFDETIQTKAEEVITKYQNQTDAVITKYRPRLEGKTVALMVGGLRPRHVVPAFKDGQDSTTNEKDYKPFWDKFCLEMSSKLYAATKTDWQDLESNSLTTSVINTIQNSWFSTALIGLQKESLSKTSWHLFMSSVPNSTDSENTNKKSKKIRIYPEATLRLVYRKWFAACRWCYNQAIAYQRDCLMKGERQPSKHQLRDIILKSCPDWVAQCPYSPREESVFDAKNAFSKTATRNQVNPRFKSCREPVKSLRIGSKYWGAFYSGRGKDKQIAGFTHYAASQVTINSETFALKDLQLNPVELFIKSINDLVNALTDVEAREDIPQYTVEFSTCY